MRPQSPQDIIQSRASSSLSLTRQCNILRETKIKSDGIDWYVSSLLRYAARKIPNVIDDPSNAFVSFSVTYLSPRRAG